MNLRKSLADCLNAWRPIIYIVGADFETIDDAISGAVADLGWKDVLEEYTHASGRVNFKSKEPCSVMDEISTCSESCTMRLARYLDDYISDCGIKRILVLKDVHGELGDPMIVARLKSFALRLAKEKDEIQVVIVSPRKVIPLELDNYITVIEHSSPGTDDIKQKVEEYVEEAKKKSGLATLSSGWVFLRSTWF